ncbi:Ferritin/DPS_protein domain [Hexamita inflata]|uniref:Ferritin/DPS protein domain n=1 Tax=Hexamita inflata TaxID=28002 RepID=A0AA86U198_9EUKA|nr:Ferritin/DPS protein domain [Hexamita inflata]
MNLLAENEMKAFLGYQKLALVAKANAYDELATFFLKEAADELAHYHQLADFCVKQKIEVNFSVCDCKIEGTTIRHLLEAALALEKKISEGVNKYYDGAKREEQLFLDFFVQKQFQSIADYEHLLMREKLLGVIILNTLK